MNFRWTVTFCVEKSCDGMHLAFGSTLDCWCHFKHVSLKKKPVLLLSNEHGWEVKDQGRRQCCHNKHKKFPYRPTCDVSLLCGHVSYVVGYNHENCGLYHNLVYWSILSYKNSIHTTLQCNWCHVCVLQSLQCEMRQTGEESDNVGNMMKWFRCKIWMCCFLQNSSVQM